MVSGIENGHPPLSELVPTGRRMLTLVASLTVRSCGDVTASKRTVTPPPRGCGSTLACQYLREGEGSCGGRGWSPRMVLSWLDRNPSAGVAFAVPLAIVLLGGMVAHPFLFVLVPLLMLGV